ncbi:DUF6461 domain-containing protein [Streptosporangium sp. NPDC051023]|uniref:DUF6461 domain-containing protein n=1 Tax=Streptosporangium sp. NPDC051023 TaxID=3155410 RepID=UPI00344E528A
MTDPRAEFRWLSCHGPLHDIYCVSFVRGLSPHEVLARLEVDTNTTEEMTFDELDDRALRGVEEFDGEEAGYVGAVKVADWTVLVEPWGWRVPVNPGVLDRLSRGSEVVSVKRHDYASDRFVHAIEGKVILGFEPEAPQHREGSDPRRWEAAMREVGLGRRSFDDPMPDDPIASAFALAERITGVAFTKNVLDMRFLCAIAREE